MATRYSRDRRKGGQSQHVLGIHTLPLLPTLPLTCEMESLSPPLPPPTDEETETLRDQMLQARQWWHYTSPLGPLLARAPPQEVKRPPISWEALLSSVVDTALSSSASVELWMEVGR